MLFRTLVLPAIVATSLLSMNANAALDANQTLNQFNAIVFGNINSNSHIDGRAWVGGNVVGGEYSGHPSDTPASNYSGLTVKGNAENVKTKLGAVVYGNLSNSALNDGSNAILGTVSNTNLNGGPAYVPGSASGSNFNGGRITDISLIPTTLQTNLDAVDSTNFYNLLSNTSNELKQLSNTSNFNQNGNKTTFNAVADSSGLAVFNFTDLESTSIFASSEFEFFLNGATTVVINVGLTDITNSSNFLANSAINYGEFIVWNFYNAENITLNNQFGGSILAVNATLTNNQNIEGGVFVNNLIQRGEIHLQPFSGNVITAVPEPSSYAMFLLGLGLLAFGVRRRA